MFAAWAGDIMFAKCFMYSALRCIDSAFFFLASPPEGPDSNQDTLRVKLKVALTRTKGSASVSRCWTHLELRFQHPKGSLV